jgi:hypothetical protein
MLRAVSDQVPSSQTSFETIGLADMSCTETVAVVRSWQKSRGWHAMPSFRSWIDAELGPAIAHASVAGVVDGGADYEFLYIGDAHQRAYGADPSGKRVSDIAALAPRFAKQLKASYDTVRISAAPQAFRVSIGREFPQARFAWFETVYLPLGQHGSVEHIVNAAVYRMRGAQ